VTDTKLEQKDEDTARRARECDGEKLTVMLKGGIAGIAKSRGLSAADVAEASGLTVPDLVKLLNKNDDDPAKLWPLMNVLRSLGAMVVLGVDHSPRPGKGAVVWVPLSPVPGLEDHADDRVEVLPALNP
jgi:hypothetical protein